MIKVKFNDQKFIRELNNIADYAEGFVEGTKLGKVDLLESIGGEVILGLKEFIDASARVNPMSLHHVYEWLQTGSPQARLFDIDYRATNLGLSFNSRFRQSVTIKDGSKTPFYNKAEIMENGIPVTIKPVSSSVLAFDVDGKTVFTKKTINVSEPGGDYTQGSYEQAFNQFFNQYFKQSFLQASGILRHLENPAPFKYNIAKGKRGGRAAGISVGYRWIARKGR